MASFALYNLVIGYLLINGAHRGLQGLLLFGRAIGLHLLVTDHSLRHQHQQTYRRIGRWILAAVILVGWGLGVLVVFSEAVVSAFEAFIGGGIIMNVLEEELPEDRSSRPTALLVGAAGYSALLVAF
jgi:multisubunit Na+/H+ antiporter MnhB subunit